VEHGVPQGEVVRDVAFALILFSIVLTAVLAFLLERGAPRDDVRPAAASRERQHFAGAPLRGGRRAVNRRQSPAADARRAARPSRMGSATFSATV